MINYKINNILVKLLIIVTILKHFKIFIKNLQVSTYTIIDMIVGNVILFINTVLNRERYMRDIKDKLQLM